VKLNRILRQIFGDSFNKINTSAGNCGQDNTFELCLKIRYCQGFDAFISMEEFFT